MRPELPEPPHEETCVLCSGGLDSVVLVAWAAQHADVQPVYVRAGLAWEAEELARLAGLVARPRVRAPTVLEFDLRDLYPPSHWALRGTPPDYDTPDEDVYLPGRNVLLLSKAAVLAASRRIGRIMLGPLAGNPFPDATPQFFDTMSAALSLGLAHRLQVEAPFTVLHKADVIRLGAKLEVKLEDTLSCMNPKSGVHCGLCSKCRERRDGFAEAGVEDRTPYAARSPR
ncbi:MAG: 7-cyano-7-deazaguanine synthase [Bacteroidales bacterium]